MELDHGDGGKPDFQEDFALYSSLQKVRELDAKLRPGVEDFVLALHEGLERNVFVDERSDGSVVTDLARAKLCAMLSLMKFTISGSSPSGPESSGSSRLPPM